MFVAVRARTLFYNCRRQHLQAVNPTDIDSLLNEHALSSSSLLSLYKTAPNAMARCAIRLCNTRLHCCWLPCGESLSLVFHDRSNFNRHGQPMALPGEDGIELASKHGQRTGVKTGVSQQSEFPTVPSPLSPLKRQGPKSLVKHLLSVEPVEPDSELAGSCYFKPQTEILSVARPAAAIPRSLLQCVSRTASPALPQRPAQ